MSDLGFMPDLARQQEEEDDWSRVMQQEDDMIQAENERAREEYERRKEEANRKREEARKPLNPLEEAHKQAVQIYSFLAKSDVVQDMLDNPAVKEMLVSRGSLMHDSFRLIAKRYIAGMQDETVTVSLEPGLLQARTKAGTALVELALSKLFQQEKEKEPRGRLSEFK